MPWSDSPSRSSALSWASLQTARQTLTGFVNLPLREAMDRAKSQMCHALTNSSVSAEWWLCSNVSIRQIPDFRFCQLTSSKIFRSLTELISCLGFVPDPCFSHPQRTAEIMYVQKLNACFWQICLGIQLFVFLFSFLFFCVVCCYAPQMRSNPAAMTTELFRGS